MQVNLRDQQLKIIEHNYQPEIYNRYTHSKKDQKNFEHSTKDSHQITGEESKRKMKE